MPNKKCSAKKYIVYTIAICIIIFLALPIIFKDNMEDINSQRYLQKALPLKTENPFTQYLNLLKNFYTPAKKGSSFTKINNSLLAKNSQNSLFNKQESDSENETETKPEAPVRNAPADANNNYNNYQTNIQTQNYETLENPEQIFVKQEPFEDFLMEGLYETSQTDPYEVKLNARRNLTRILEPDLISFFSPKKQLKQDFVSENPLVNNYSNNANILTQRNNDNTFASAAHNYINNIINPFNTRNIIKDKIDIEGLDFDDQVNLVANRLLTIQQTNKQAQSRTNNGSNNKDNQDPNRPPLPPATKDTFTPEKWTKEINTSCDTSEPDQANTISSEIKQKDMKIDTCDPEISKKLAKVNSKMQEEYNYLIVSGRYKNKIMIPAQLSLPEKVLTSIASDDDGIFTLNLPKDLRTAKKFAQNTEKTEFNFVAALKPQAFEKIMQDEKTILLSVDEEDQKRFPQKTILIQSGGIETYQGANEIIQQINNFQQKQAELKKAAKNQEKKDKEQKTQDLKGKIDSTI